MSRSPIKGFAHSNGHGRRQPGLEVVSRQSNLIVESSNAVPEARLRQMLIDEVKKQNKPYGLYFQDISGGFTSTQRGGRAGLQGDSGDRVSRLCRTAGPTNWCAAPISSARRFPASPRFWRPRTSRKSSTATAAPNRAAFRSRRSRRRFWCRRSKSKRRPRATTVLRFCPNRPRMENNKGGAK